MLPFTTDAAAMTDLERDGNLDLVAMSWGIEGPSNVVVVRSDGAGDYAWLSFPEGDHDAMDLALGDVDGDALPDLVTFHPRLGEVHARRGDGVGGFMPLSTFALAKQVNGGTLRDLDGDGALDIVVEQFTHVAALHGDGHGRFTSRPRIRVGGAPSYGVFTDVDGDARIDYVVTSTDHSIVDVLRIGRDGALGKRRSVACGEATVGMTAGDFDGDGIGDVATRGGRAEDVCVFLGSSGGLRLGARIERGFGDHDVSHVVALDVDGDHKDELALSLWESGIELYRFAQPGTMTQLDRFVAGHDRRQAWSRDVDGDGKGDLVLVNSGSPTFLPVAGIQSGGHLNPGPASFTIVRGRGCPAS